MATCPLHPAATTTKRTVPMEVYPSAGAPPYRLAEAQMHCCGQCGSEWYEEDEVARLPHVGIATVPAPVQDNWDC